MNIASLYSKLAFFVVDISYQHTTAYTILPQVLQVLQLLSNCTESMYYQKITAANSSS